MVIYRAFRFENTQLLKIYYWKTLQPISKIKVFIKPMFLWNFGTGDRYLKMNSGGLSTQRE
jgi:hypothetical protein